MEIDLAQIIGINTHNAEEAYLCGPMSAVREEGCIQREEREAAFEKSRLRLVEGRACSPKLEARESFDQRCKSTMPGLVKKWLSRKKEFRRQKKSFVFSKIPVYCLVLENSRLDFQDPPGQLLVPPQRTG